MWRRLFCIDLINFEIYVFSIFSAIGLLGAIGPNYLTDSQQAKAISHMSDTIDVYCNSYGPTGTVSSSSLGPLLLAAFENNAKYVSSCILLLHMFKKNSENHHKI